MTSILHLPPEPLPPSKAFILAAGLGTRMRPLTDLLPKPLLPLWGRTLIEHLIALLADWGVTDIRINLHHHVGVLRAALEKTAAVMPGLRLSFAEEPEILGTGGPLAPARAWLGDAPFWLVNADIAADLDPAPLLREYARLRPVAVLWLDPRRGPRTVRIRGNRIVNFRDARPGSPGTATFCGLHLIAPAIFDYLPAAGPASIIDAYRAAMLAGKRISGVAVEGSFWADLGTPERYIQAHRDVRDAARRKMSGARLFSRTAVSAVPALRGTFAAVGRRARVASGAQLANCVVWDGAHIGPHVVLRDAIVAEGVLANAAGAQIALRAGSIVSNPAIPAAVRALGWSAAKTMALYLPPRASGRSFVRLVCGARRALLICDTGERDEIRRYAGHARFLIAHGIPVARVLADRPGEHFLVVEDLGALSLEQLAPRSAPAALEALYRRVLDGAIKLHAIPAAAVTAAGLVLQPAFGPELYKWEREYFAEHYLRGLRAMNSAAVRPVLIELQDVAARLNQAPFVLLHRDLQSSNLLLRGGQPHLIDFQGMRFGPAVYDLASLLADPYVMLPENMQRRLLAHYVRRGGVAINETLFWFGAVERLAQALGAFARLSGLPGMAHFHAYLPRGERMLRRALRHTPGLSRLRDLMEK